MSDRFKFRALFEHIATGKKIWMKIVPGQIVSDWGYLQKSDWLQCTGLKDKNGVLIYESDIVKGVDDVGLKFVAVIEWYDDDAGFLINLNDVIAPGADMIFLSDCQSLEIIGNRFENPELLELTND